MVNIKILINKYSINVQIKIKVIKKSFKEEKKMTENKTFSLDRETVDFLDDFKKRFGINKSKLIKNLLKYYKNNQKELFRILIGDEL